MINFTINGKNFNNEDMNLLICYDSIKDFTEMKMYCDHEEIQLDDSTADIDVTVNIKSNGLLEKFEHNSDTRASVELINRALAIIKRETRKIQESAK